MESELLFDPRREALAELPDGDVEMTEFESAFLCGLIRSRRPKNIVEVGVAAGGTTAILVKTIDMLGLHDQTRLWSVDLNEAYYKDHGKRTGFMADGISTRKPVRRKMLLGKFLPEWLPAIAGEAGDGIDFVILDTVHKTPGEMLDFLAILPYLTPDACVVLHDIGAQHYWGDTTTFATQLVLSVVTADLILREDPDRQQRYPNIGAFTVNAETRKYVRNVFCALTLPWHYLPGAKELSLYRAFYAGHYDDECLRLFDMAAALHAENMRAREPEKPQPLTVRPDTVLYFDGDHGNARPFCIAGLSSAEGDYTWTDGSVLLMSFPLKAGTEVRSLTLRCAAYGGRQPVRALANSIPVKRFTVTAEGDYAVPIPPKTRKSGSLDIALEFPRAVSPHDREGTDDERRLALRLYRMWFS